MAALNAAFVHWPLTAVGATAYSSIKHKVIITQFSVDGFTTV